MGDDFMWQPPGPGTWTLDRTHFPRPICGYSQHNRERLFAGQGRGFERLGIGIGDMRARFVNGWQFGQRAPLAPDLAAGREPVALATLDRRAWRGVVDHWEAVERPEIVASVAAVVVAEPRSMADDELAAHLEEARRVHYRAADLHFEHIAVFTTIGALVIACRQWGVAPGDAIALLRGSSPTSAETARALQPLADALRRAGIRPTSLDEVREAGPDASVALDSYLERFGLRMVGGFDFCDVTLAEVPDAVVATIVAALDRPSESTDSAALDLEADVRGRVPAGERQRFEDLLSEARYCYGLRDDDVAPFMTARGVVRRALLAAGERMRLADPAHVFEATFDEVVASLVGGGPRADAAELAERASLRARQAAADPPPFLGPPPSPPDLSALPPAVRELTAGFLAYGELMFLNARTPMSGFGIGTGPVRGRAVVVRDPEDAFARLDPGDVLVTTMTTPAFNAVLPLAGALVTEEGGLLSHAAIISRELGVPAVIGVTGVMSAVVDGDDVEVDPASGAVTNHSR